MMKDLQALKQKYSSDYKRFVEEFGEEEGEKLFLSWVKVKEKMRKAKEKKTKEKTDAIVKLFNLYIEKNFSNVKFFINVNKTLFTEKELQILFSIISEIEEKKKN